MKTLHLPTKVISPLAGKALQLLSQARKEDDPEAREFLRSLAATYCQRARRAQFEKKQQERQQREEALAWANAFADEDHGSKRIHYVDVIRGLPEEDKPMPRRVEAKRGARLLDMWA